MPGTTFRAKSSYCTGSSASGKSSAVSALANSLPGTWAVISQDGVRSIVKAGYLTPVNGGAWVGVLDPKSSLG